MPTEASSRAPALEALMARFRATGDPEALGALFDVTAPGLFRLALTLVPDPASAEDTVQETFLAAIESADRHDPGRPVLPWLVGILHHKASKVRYRRQRTPDPQRLPPLAVSGDPARIAGDHEEEERVRAALDELPEPYREVALLRWRHGLEPAEIAALKRTSPGTVRSHLHRALEKVRRRMTALPALLFARGAERDPRGLDAVRRIVVGKAGAAAPVASGAMAATAIGGILMAKKVLAACVILLLGASGWWALSNGSLGTGPGKQGTAPGIGGPRVVDGTRIVVAAQFPDASAGLPPLAGGRSEGTERGFATGVVVNREDEPVGGALVVSLPDTLPGPITATAVVGPGGVGRSARSDEQGRFRVPLPETSPMSTLYIEAPGYAPTVETEVPQRGADIRIVLDRPALLSGRVLDLEGKPVPGARVRLLYLMDSARVERNAVSGEDGAYRIDGVPPRRRFARPLNSDAVIEVQAEGFAPLLTGQFFRAGSAIANPGEEGHLDLYLTRGATLRGRVLDGETAAPVEGARVVLFSIEQTTYFSRPGQTTSGRGLIVPRTLGETLSAADGTFQFGGLPSNGKTPLLTFNMGKKGLQVGVVGAMKQGLVPFTDEVPVVDEGAVVETTLRLWPAASVTGRVVEKDGRPVEGAGVRVEMDGRQENAWFPADLYPGVPSAAAKTDADGRYRAEGVRAAREGTSDGRVLAARHGMVLLNQPGGIPIEVSAGKTTGVPDIVLEEPPDPSISILVVDGDGKPVWGAMVTGAIMAFSGRTGTDGRVLLRSPIYGGSYRPDAPPEIAFTIQARGYGSAHVTGTPSTTEVPEIRVVLVEGHRLSGTVKEADGSPTAVGTTVMVADGNLSVEEAFQVSSGTGQPRGILAWANCGEDGKFKVEDLPPGPYHLTQLPQFAVDLGHFGAFGAVGEGRFEPGPVAW
jgi:RNA polymerase sigma-70 factor (ECF subfamily)